MLTSLVAASLLADSRHMTSELGMQFQAYIEGSQLNYTAPRGRVLLLMVAALLP